MKYISKIQGYFPLVDEICKTSFGYFIELGNLSSLIIKEFDEFVPQLPFLIEEEDKDFPFYKDQMSQKGIIII